MLRLASWSIVSMLALSACGSDDDSDPVVTKTVSGNLTYTGSETGTLMVAISTVAMPQCPNDQPEKYESVLNATFPHAFSFTGLKGGDYYVAALFDVGGNLTYPFCPQADDICGRTVSFVTVNDTTPAGTVDFTLNVQGCGVTN